MSPRLRQLSESEVKSILQSFGFKVHPQRGSHVKLRREVSFGKQTLTIPLHDELDAGTLKASFILIFTQNKQIPLSSLSSIKGFKKTGGSDWDWTSDQGQRISLFL